MDLDADAVRASIKSIIVSIKPLAEGFDEISDDAPLFSDGSGRESPVNLDSLDALDLAMSIGDEFGLGNQEFERLFESEDGLERLRTVNDITDVILSLANNGGETAGVDGNLRRKGVTA